MSAFHKMIATVKSALERAPRAVPAHGAATSPVVPVAHDARRTELLAQFARELEAVGGSFLGAYAPDEIRARTVALAREIDAHTASIGAGVTLDADPIARALEQAGVAVIRPPRATEADEAARAAFRERLAGCVHAARALLAQLGG